MNRRPSSPSGKALILTGNPRDIHAELNRLISRYGKDMPLAYCLSLSPFGHPSPVPAPVPAPVPVHRANTVLKAV